MESSGYQLNEISGRMILPHTSDKDYSGESSYRTRRIAEIQFSLVSMKFYISKHPKVVFIRNGGKIRMKTPDFTQLR